MGLSEIVQPLFIPDFTERGTDYGEFKLGISFRLQGGQVVMQFSDSVDRVRMTGGGARKLAQRLIEKAAELDRLGTASAPTAKARALKAPRYRCREHLKNRWLATESSQPESIMPAANGATRRACARTVMHLPGNIFS